MPSITKQTNKPQSPALRPEPTTEQISYGVKLLCYGRSKTGKTRLIATFPKPLLLVGTEDGTKSIATSRKLKKKYKGGWEIHTLYVAGKELGIDFCKLHNSEQINELSAIVKPEGYKTIGVDTAGGVQDLILKEVLNLDDIPVQKSWGMTDRQTWGVVGQQFKERLRCLLRLADIYGINVPVVAHERNFKEDEDAATSDFIFPTVGAALTPSAAGWLNAEVDYICQTFIRAQTVDKQIRVGEVVSTKQQPTGKMEYCLRVGPHPIFMTGFRTVSDEPLPDCLINPTFDKILKLIHGQK